MGNLEDSLLARLARMRSAPSDDGAGMEDLQASTAQPTPTSSPQDPTASPTSSQLPPGQRAAVESETAALQPSNAGIAPAGQRAADDDDDARLDSLLNRIHNLAQGKPAEEEVRGSMPADRATAIPAQPARETMGAAAAPGILSKSQARASSETADKKHFPDDAFLPLQKNSFLEMELSESAVEELILKYLLNRGDGSGRAISDQVRLPFLIMEPLLRRMKEDQLVVYRGSAPMNDYVYQLTEIGRERAKRLVEHCTYFGAAPVSLTEYIDSIRAQSLTHQNPCPEDLEKAFRDLLISPNMLRRLGPAINSGRGMFLFGLPGNGKTSIAKRVTRAFGHTIWVPRAVGVDGEIIRVFDPMNHEEVPLTAQDGLIEELKLDQRWVRICRPTIVVGGELTMDQLEVTYNKQTGISEAPLQMKSNCGSLVIDDFGRQRMAVDELLNRWIVPLEERIDFLNLPSGKKLQVPFDQLIVFSTNLEPRDLVDEAFLRRIPYKIEVVDPTEAEFRKLFELMCKQLKVELDEDALNYLLAEHYLKAGRKFRACHPRDLLMQICNFCRYQQQEPRLSPEAFDFAVENYFAVM